MTEKPSLKNSKSPALTGTKTKFENGTEDKAYLITAKELLKEGDGNEDTRVVP